MSAKASFLIALQVILLTRSECPEAKAIERSEPSGFWCEMMAPTPSAAGFTSNSGL